MRECIGQAVSVAVGVNSLAMTTFFSYLLALSEIVFQTVFILVMRLKNSVQQILVSLGNHNVVPKYFRGN